jgi:hypothetical protein
MAKLDPELEQYRRLMTVPTTFGDGFSMASLVGVLFVALVMVPGSIYMDLLLGQSIGGAAQWVTAILFAEVAKRANVRLSRPELWVLFYMSGTVLGGAAQGNLLFNQYLPHSEAAVSQGISDQYPNWFAPKDPHVYDHHSFFQLAWLPALGLWLFGRFFGQLDNNIIGYGLFRLTSDIEKLPFPMAPVGAQGVLALADDLEGKSEVSWRWRVFSIGAALGMAFSVVYMALPALTGAFFGNTYSIFPVPFADWTNYTKDILPAVATGIVLDLGILISGMVIPFSAVMGALIATVVTIILNPILYHYHILHSWTTTDANIIDTSFKNYTDLYFSFGIGIALAIAVVGFSSILKLRRAATDSSALEKSEPAIPSGRGDIPNRWVLICYIVSTFIYIGISGYLVGWHPGVMAVLIFFGFLYTPVISYVTARLEGLISRQIDIPFIRELSFLLSGYQGVAIWLLPVPMSNYGTQTVRYRQTELTGTRFTSIWKADFFLFPVVIIANIFFASYIWGLADIPSGTYAFAQKMWPLMAKQTVLVHSSTSGEYSQFQEALSGVKVATGFGVGMVLYWVLSMLGAPTMMLYGIVGGIGTSYPPGVILLVGGGLLGKYYFQKRFGLRWLEYAPVLMAGYGCGFGLVGMLAIGLIFLAKSSSSLPY